MFDDLMKQELTREQKAMIFTLSLLSSSGIGGLEKMNLSSDGEEQIKDFSPNTEEVEKCIDILVKKGYLRTRV